MDTTVKNQFLEDTANHGMTVHLDNGLYRHVQFKRQGSCIYAFDLVTWPGHLSISGDMGTFTFRRLDDMFEFFRSDPKERGPSFGYWAQKCQAMDTRGSGIREYSYDKFKQAIADEIKEAVESGELVVTDELNEALEELRDEGECSLECAYRAIESFNDTRSEYRFQDFHEHDLMEFSYTFLWCCYAIQWGIQQYDAAKAGS